MEQCHGYSQPITTAMLIRCEYPAAGGGIYCYFHEKVASGLITDASWVPHPPEPPAEHDAIDSLFVAWGLTTEISVERAPELFEKLHPRRSAGSNGATTARAAAIPVESGSA